VVLKFGISFENFRFLKPSINENCTNLLLGDSYCVQPVGDSELFRPRFLILLSTLFLTGVQSPRTWVDLAGRLRPSYLVPSPSLASPMQDLHGRQQAKSWCQSQLKRRLRTELVKIVFDTSTVQTIKMPPT
jgi:hypothetical protein